MRDYDSNENKRSDFDLNTEENNTASEETSADETAAQNGHSHNETGERHAEHAHAYASRNEQPRWQPDPEKYNCGGTNTVTKPEKTSAKWVVPLVVVLAVMIVVIALGVIFGARYLRNMVNADTKVSTADTEKILSDTQEPVTVAKSSSDDISVVITDVSDIVEQVKPAVVSITSRTLINKYSSNDLYDYFFRYFYGDEESEEQEEIESGLGSGTIIGKSDTELLVLTSYHVVEGSSSLAVTFANDVSVDGTIKSSSNETDIAIVSVPIDKIDSETLNSITIAQLSADPAEVGEGVVVIGNPLGYGISVTSGIVSAVDRQIEVDSRTLTVMQTDAAINMGNSGGCVLNSKGQVIGISEAKICVSGVEGMNYAIPISNNSELIDVLLENESGKNAEEETKNPATGAYLGIRGRDITGELAEAYGLPKGVHVSSVLPGGGAESAGIQQGDIIVGIDNVKVETMEVLQQELEEHNVGDTVTVTFERAGTEGYDELSVEAVLTGKNG